MRFFGLIVLLLGFSDANRSHESYNAPSIWFNLWHHVVTNSNTFLMKFVMNDKTALKSVIYFCKEKNIPNKTLHYGDYYGDLASPIHFHIDEKNFTNITI